MRTSVMLFVSALALSAVSITAQEAESTASDAAASEATSADQDLTPVLTQTGIQSCTSVVTTTSSSPVNPAGGSCEVLSGHDVEAGSHISGFRYRFCGEVEIPLFVRIERFLSPGVWEVVASGTGEATYHCNGNAFNRYRIPLVTPAFEILCG